MSSKAEYFDALIIFTHRVEPEILVSLFYKHRTVRFRLTTENHKLSKNIVHVTIPQLAVHCGRKELVKSLFTGIPSPVCPFIPRFFCARCSPCCCPILLTFPHYLNAWNRLDESMQVNKIISSYTFPLCSSAIIWCFVYSS